MMKFASLFVALLCASAAAESVQDARRALDKAMAARIAELQAQKAAEASLFGSNASGDCEAATTCADCFAAGENNCRWCVETDRCYAFTKSNCPIPLNVLSARLEPRRAFDEAPHCTQ